MLQEAIDILSDWGSLDTSIVITAALAGMACALPGNFLVLRKQSMMGDALSHTVLPGIVFAFLLAYWLDRSGYISETTRAATLPAALFGGAIVIGILSAVLTEWVHRLGRVESSAALGVVFITLFAFGLLLIRLKADSVHIDPDCVLFGSVETPKSRQTWMVGILLCVNLLLVTIFYKELKVSAFDPGLATSLGIHAKTMHYALMAVTAATLVAAFESVGSILVIAMLIAPPATAYLLTDRLSHMIILSLLIAALSAVLGHVMAVTVPPLIFPRLGFAGISDASTSGSMAFACGLLFFLAMLFGPRHGVISKLLSRSRLTVRIAGDDILGMLYRLEERQIAAPQEQVDGMASQVLGVGPLLRHAAWWRLAWKHQISSGQLTEAGRQAARQLVRSHRLWESYLSKHFELPPDHLHEPASRAEHFIDEDLREQLARELGPVEKDPHGQEIPGNESAERQTPRTD